MASLPKVIRELKERITELEKEKETLLSMYSQLKDTIHDCTITDEEALERLLLWIDQDSSIVDPMLEEQGK
jgi:uncharacterized protein YaaN involved in tellurite resistance